jgi:hypothetical protein
MRPLIIKPSGTALGIVSLTSIWVRRAKHVARESHDMFRASLPDPDVRRSH